MRATEIHAYWFGAPDAPEHGTRLGHWFRAGPEVDIEIRDRFLDDYRRAVDGDDGKWRVDPRTCLSLVLLFDQFPRHMFRGRARAYATDARALALARFLVDGGHDRGLMTVEKGFVYLPFEHSEDVDDQRRAVALISGVEEHAHKERSVASAIKHLEIIERFGRFPHRNEILGRRSTPEEIRFLEENDDVRFGTDRHQDLHAAFDDEF